MSEPRYILTSTQRLRKFRISSWEGAIRETAYRLGVVTELIRKKC